MEFDLTSPPPIAANRPACILVVEDEVLVRVMISDFLREADFDVVEACDADEAISILHSGITIDLVLSDVRMPGPMDGLGLLEYSRNNFPTLPVIITSGHLSPNEALARGAAQYLGKPYSFEYAVALLELELNKSR